MAFVTSGKITSTGSRIYLPLPYGTDRFDLVNLTKLTAGGANTGVRYEWFRGFGDGEAIRHIKTAGTDAIAPGFMTAGGFTEYNSSRNPIGALQAYAAISGDPIPRVTSVTHGLATGDIVRMIDTDDARQLGGLDFTVTRFDADNFDLAHMDQIVAAAVAGNFRLLKFAPIFYPSNRIITKVAIGATTLVTLSVDHNYVVGQVLRFIVPEAFGATQLNGLTGTITHINQTDGLSTNTVRVNINSAAFTPFAFPATASLGEFTPAQVIPVGKDAHSDYVAADVATRNTSSFGLIIPAGANAPAGVANDVLYWTAYKTDNSEQDGQ
jgi:hypothetical protein